jgi:hypothetical protein
VVVARSGIAVACRAVASLGVAWSAGACSSWGSVVSTGAPETAALPGAYLASLSVSPSADGSSVLVPDFDPAIHDYYVRCAAGTNALTISMTASAGARSLLLQPTMSDPAPRKVLSLDVQENQAIVVAASDGTTSNEYWVRCLPSDFPRMRMDLHPEVGAPTPGFYLIGSQPATGGAGYAIVLDGHGVPVWYHREDHRVWDVDSVVSGAISFLPDETSTGFQVHQLSPLETIYVAPKGDSTNVHDFRHLPNGNFLIFSDLRQTGVDLTGFSSTLPDGSVATLGPNGAIHSCIILEVDPTGNVVWKWDAMDHFSVLADSTFGHLEPATIDAAGIVTVDPFHCNSIDVDPTNGSLLVSARNMDSVFYIDRSSDAVLWKMGGVPYTRDGAVYVAVADPFHRQHDARLQPGWSSVCAGSGQLSLFDDATSTGGAARASLYQVTVGAPDGPVQCGVRGATLVWQYSGSYDSSFMGSFRIQSDGSRTIGWGSNGAADLVFTDINAVGQDVLDFHFTDDSASYRSIKVPLGSLDLGLLRSTAGL